MKKLLLALAVVLSACGGGGGGSQAPSVTAAVVSPVVVVAMYGDSTQAGVAPDSASLHPPAATIQALLTGVQVTSYGIAGTKLESVDVGTTWAQKIRDSGAQVVVENHAINDSWLGRETPTANYKAKLISMAEEVKAQGKTFVLETPNPVLSGANIEDKVQAMREVAASTGTVLCDVYQDLKDKGLDTLAAIPDGTHPSTTTYQVIAAKVASCLSTLTLQR